MINKYSCYEYCIVPVIVMTEGLGCMAYIYRIFETEYEPSDITILLESEEYYDTKDEAEQACKKHIDRLESGEQ